MSEPPGPHTTLEFYPWIIVRFACRSCQAYRNKRLALLAEQFGASTTIEYLLGRFIGECPHRPRKRNGRPSHRYIPCGAYCPDLGATPPPDLPPAMMPLKLIKGGKDDMLPGHNRPAERRRRVGGEE